MVFEHSFGEETASPPPLTLPTDLTRTLQQEVPFMARLVLSATAEQCTGGTVDAEEVGDDLLLWLDAFTNSGATATVLSRFEARVSVHLAGGLTPGDVMLLQHAISDVVSWSVAEKLSLELREVSGTKVSRTANSITRRVLNHIATALAGVGDPASSSGKHMLAMAADSLPLEERSAAASNVPMRWCLAAVFEGSSRGEQEARSAVRRFLGRNPNALISSRKNTEMLLTAFTTDRPHVPNDFGPYGLVPVDDGNTMRAYRRAAIAAAVARHYRLDKVESEALPLVSALDLTPQERDSYAETCLGPLLAVPGNEHLLATLRAYLAHNMCSAAAARSIFVHRHTLTYRLRCVKKLTGLDMKNPLHRLRVELALLFVDLGLLATSRNEAA